MVVAKNKVVAAEDKNKVVAVEAEEVMMTPTLLFLVKIISILWFYNQKISGS